MNLYIPFIHKIVKKDKKQIQLPLYIEDKFIENNKKEEKKEEDIIIIDLF